MPIVAAHYLEFSYGLEIQSLDISYDDAYRNDTGNAARSYRLPQATIMAEFVTATGPRTTKDSDADKKALTDLYQLQTEMHLAVIMIKNPPRASTLNFEDLVSFTMNAVIYSLPFNESHTLTQVDFRGQTSWLEQPSTADVSATMLDVYQDAFMTQQGICELQTRYRDGLGLQGIEILRTRVEDDDYNVRNGAVKDDPQQVPSAPGNGSHAPLPTETPSSSSNDSDNKSLLTMIVAGLAACSVLLAVFGILASICHRRQRHRNETIQIVKVDGNQLPGFPTTNKDTDFSLGGHVNICLVSGLAEEDRPGDLLRGWAEDTNRKIKYGQSVRKDRSRATKSQTPSIKIVGLESPLVSPGRLQGNAIRGGTISKKYGICDRLEIEDSSSFTAGGGSTSLDDTATREHRSDELCSLPRAKTEPIKVKRSKSCDAYAGTVDDQQKLYVDSPDICSYSFDDLTDIPQTDIAKEEELATKVNHAASDITSSMPSGSCTPTGEQITRVGLMRAWSHDDDQARSAEKTIEKELPRQVIRGADGLMRAWDYGDESTIEHVSSDDEAMLKKDIDDATILNAAAGLPSPEAGTYKHIAGFHLLSANISPEVAKCGDYNEEDTQPTLDISYETG